ncbi:MAG: hypothetical protein EOO39_31555 [Cytophagaceae bacterium]|nr:MAG: hypothetical protein EOO39_31555 [Cytophagaceae bacterium]
MDTLAASPALFLTGGGNVGLGTTAPRATLDVAGTMVGKPAVAVAASTVDFATGNTQFTTANCGAFALNNLKDGGAYTFVVKGVTATTCAFTAFTDAGSTPLTVHLPPGHGATTAGKHTMYNFQIVGADLYAAWIPNY